MKWLRSWWYSVLDWLYIFRRQFQALFSKDSTTAFMPTDPQKGKPPVILIPGVYEPWFVMKPIAKAIQAAGYPVHVIEGLGYNTGAVPAMALVVRHYIDTMCLSDVVIVAHSKGGLIGKYLLANHNADGTIRHLVAINTPFAGSVYAYLSPIRGIRIFAPNGEVISQLSANKQLNTRITSVYSQFDPNIPKGSHLDGARNYPVQAVGHFRILEDPEVKAIVLNALKLLP